MTQPQTYGSKGMVDRQAIEDVLAAWYAEQESALSPMPPHIKACVEALRDLPTDAQVAAQDSMSGALPEINR